MSEVARELRALALALEEACRRSSVNGMAYEYVRYCSDYLCLRAHVIELEEAQRHPPRQPGDTVMVRDPPPKITAENAGFINPVQRVRKVIVPHPQR